VSRSGIFNLSSGMEISTCATLPSMPMEAIPLDFRLAAIIDVCCRQYHFVWLMSARRLLHCVQTFADCDAFLARRRRRHTCHSKCDSRGFGRRRRFRNWNRFIRKINMTDTPISSADPDHDGQNRKENKSQATFCKTSCSSFRRWLNWSVHLTISFRSRP
jgi:hypothetical protein